MQIQPILVSFLIIVTCVTVPLIGYRYALEENQIEWSFTTVGDVISQPAIGDLNGDNNLDVVFPTFRGDPDWDGYLFAVDGISGDILWSKYLENPSTFSSPVIGDIDNDAKPEVVVQLGDNNLHAFNGEDGSPIWTTIANSTLSESQPFIYDFDADNSLELVAGNIVFNASSGEFLDNMQGPMAEAIILADYDWDDTNEILIATLISELGDTIQVYSYNNGTLSLKDTIVFQSVVTGGMFDLECIDLTKDEKNEFILFTHEEVIVMENESREILWLYHVNDTYSIMNGFSSTAPIVDITNDSIPDVIVGTNDGEVIVLSGNNGSIIWMEEMSNGITHPITLSDIDNDSRDEILVRYSNDEVRILDGEDGSLIWSYRITDCDVNPVVSDLNSDSVLEAVVGCGDEGVYTVSIQGAGRDYIPPNWTTTTTTSLQTSTSTQTTSTTTEETTTSETTMTTSTSGTTTTASTTTTEPPQYVDIVVVVTGIGVFIMICAMVVILKKR